MTRHTIKAAFTRFVLIVSIVASIGVGSVGIGGTADVAAKPIDCTRVWGLEYYYYGRYMFYRDAGDILSAFQNLSLANHYLDMAFRHGC